MHSNISQTGIAKCDPRLCDFCAHAAVLFRAVAAGTRRALRAGRPFCLPACPFSHIWAVFFAHRLNSLRAGASTLLAKPVFTICILYVLRPPRSLCTHRPPLLRAQMHTEWCNLSSCAPHISHRDDISVVALRASARRPSPYPSQTTNIYCRKLIFYMKRRSLCP